MSNQRSASPIEPSRAAPSPLAPATSGLPGRLGLLARTVSHLSPVQLAFRPLHVARTQLLARVTPLARLLGSAPAPALGPPLLALTGDLPPDGGAGHLRELGLARDALDRRVEHVGRTLALVPPRTGFTLADQPKLVRYQRNYLGIIRSLAVAARTQGFEDREGAARLAVDHVREFLERRPPGAGDAWEPYVVATRLLNLVVTRELLRPVADPPTGVFLDGPWLAAIAAHARWTAATLELHLLGNHLFTDGAALFVAGASLEGAEALALRSLGYGVLARAMITDVLPDGGHAERAPSYSALFLDQLSLVLCAARALGADPPAGTQAAAERLARQLTCIAHPDGEVPLFGDSAFGEGPLPADVGAPFHTGGDSLRRRLYGELGHAPPREAIRRSDGVAHIFDRTGVAVFRSGAHQLVVDTGPLGTDDQPGHAHADALTFELSQSGRRVVVDGGAGHYDADEWRAYVRGPLAHNSVSVDSHGSDEVWSAFRAGARGVVGRPHYQRAGTFHVLRGAVTSAYGWLQERLFFFVPGRLLVTFDRLTGAPSDARVCSHLHFAPEVTLGAAPDGRGFGLAWEGGKATLLRLAGTDFSTSRARGAPEALAGRVMSDGPPRGWVTRKLGVFEPAWDVELEAAPMPWGHVVGSALVLGHAVSVGAEPSSPLASVVRLEADGVVVHAAADAHGLRWEQRPESRPTP